jgi:acetyltransferase-like isoleucine patch superfamily enzyme
MISRLERLLFSLPYFVVNSQIRCQILRRWGAKVGSEVFVSRLAKFYNPANIEIGNDSVIMDCFMQAWATIDIGNHVIINDGVKLLTGSHNLHSPDFEAKLLPIKIEDYAWIATGAMVLGGVTIGKGGVVGAGAVVRENVPPLGIVIGNPSQLIGFRRCSDFNYHFGQYLSQQM